MLFVVVVVVDAVEVVAALVVVVAAVVVVVLCPPPESCTHAPLLHAYPFGHAIVFDWHCGLPLLLLQE